MQITLTLDLSHETVDALHALVDALNKNNLKAQATENDTPLSAESKNEEAPAIPAEPAKPDEPTEEVAESPAPAEAVAPADVSFTDVRAKALAYSKKGKQAELKALFAKYGAAKLSDIPEDKLPALMADLEAADG